MNIVDSSGTYCAVFSHFQVKLCHVISSTEYRNPNKDSSSLRKIITFAVKLHFKRSFLVLLHFVEYKINVAYYIHVC